MGRFAPAALCLAFAATANTLLWADEAKPSSGSHQRLTGAAEAKLFYDDPVSGPPEEAIRPERRPADALRERIRNSDRPVIQAMLQLPRPLRDPPPPSLGQAAGIYHKASQELSPPLELPTLDQEPAELGKPMPKAEPSLKPTPTTNGGREPSRWVPRARQADEKNSSSGEPASEAAGSGAQSPTDKAKPGTASAGNAPRDPAYENGIGSRRAVVPYQQPPLTALPPPVYSESCPLVQWCPPGAMLLPRLHNWLWEIEYELWLSQGVTFNSESPRNRSNHPVGFNDRSNDYQLNQLYLVITREVDDCACGWDVGGRVDLLYGTDWRWVAARGLEKHRDMSPKWNAQDYGLAMPQCYMEVLAPLGNGVKLKLGHFYSILGYENAQATQNFFYSHSLMRQFAEPFTHTGLLGSTRVGNLTVQAGLTRGWDNWEAYGDNLGVLGGISWSSPDGWTIASFALHWGPEQETPGSDDHPRTAYSLVWQQRLSERLTYVFQHDWGVQAGHSQLGHVSWYGINQYLLYTIDDCWKVGLRIEWFRDDDGARLTPQQPLRGADYYQASLGLNYAPSRRMIVRPEVRWDWTDAAGFSPYADLTRRDQFLFACDLLLCY